MLEVDYSKNKMDRPNDRIDDDNFRRGWVAGIETLLREGRDTSQTVYHGADGTKYRFLSIRISEEDYHALVKKEINAR